MACSLLRTQPFLAVDLLAAVDGVATSPVKAVSRVSGGPKASLYRACRRAILARGGRRLTAVAPISLPDLRGFTKPTTLTTETVSRTLARLESMHAIELVSARRIVLHDPDALARLNSGREEANWPGRALSG
ncbi:MAG: helix-turn-helix domain-containing protein [Bradyrhizobium sp.]|nr:helix-turn-helix domain-containing protein [Bradyrhizobium sp.]